MSSIRQKKYNRWLRAAKARVIHKDLLSLVLAISINFVIGRVLDMLPADFEKLFWPSIIVNSILTPEFAKRWLQVDACAIFAAKLQIRGIREELKEKMWLISSIK